MAIKDEDAAGHVLSVTNLKRDEIIYTIYICIYIS